jgi:hypothetical protein
MTAASACDQLDLTRRVQNDSLTVETTTAKGLDHLIF